MVVFVTDLLLGTYEWFFISFYYVTQISILYLITIM